MNTDRELGPNHTDVCDGQTWRYSGSGYNRVRVCACGAEDHAPEVFPSLGKQYLGRATTCGWCSEWRDRIDPAAVPELVAALERIPQAVYDEIVDACGDTMAKTASHAAKSVARAALQKARGEA